MVPLASGGIQQQKTWGTCTGTLRGQTAQTSDNVVCYIRCQPGIWAGYRRVQHRAGQVMVGQGGYRTCKGQARVVPIVNSQALYKILSANFTWKGVAEQGRSNRQRYTAVPVIMTLHILCPRVSVSAFFCVSSPVSTSGYISLVSLLRSIWLVAHG